MSHEDENNMGNKRSHNKAFSALSLDRMMEKGDSAKHDKERIDQRFYDRARKLKKFHGMRKHHVGDSSLNYKEKQHESFLEDLRGEDREAYLKKKSAADKSREKFKEENRLIQKAVLAVQRYRKTQKKKLAMKKSKNNTNDEDEDDEDEEKEQQDDIIDEEDYFTGDVKLGLDLLRRQHKYINKEGKVVKMTLEQVAIDARKKKRQERVEIGKEIEEKRLLKQKNMEKRSKMAKKHQYKNKHGQKSMKVMLDDMLSKLRK